MKKLDKSILKTVYAFETEHTFFEFVLGILFIFICGILGVLAGIYVYQQLAYGQTLDLLELFSENTEVIKNYIWDVIAVFYEETPKLALLICIFFVIWAIVSLVFFIKKLKKLLTKIRSILSYWHYNRPK